jgi:hypothetical protein
MFWRSFGIETNLNKEIHMAERDFGSRSDRNTGRPDRKPAGLGPRGASGERSSGMGSGRGGSDKRQDAPAGRAQRRDGQESRPNWQERVARPVDYDKPKSPPIPDEITEKDLEMGLRAQLKTLTPENAEKVARHLVMVNLLIEQDPELAHKHAVAAAERAGRIGMVREVVGVTAYTVGEYALALRELLTFRRISGSNDQIPVMVDCERGLGRPDRALELGRSVDRASLPVSVRVNLAIAMSGARLDRGENDLALAELQIAELNPAKAFDYSPALFRAYADTLEVLGKAAESKHWFDLADRADLALAGNPGPEDELVEVLEEIEIPVLAEKKVWEPRDGDERPRRDGEDRPRRDGEDRPRREGASRPPREGERRDFAPRAPRRDGFTPRDGQGRPARRDGDAPRYPRRENDAPRTAARDEERQPRTFGRVNKSSDKPSDQRDS